MDEMQSLDQFMRNFRGNEHQKLIQSLLVILQSRGYITSFEFYSKSKRFGYKTKKKQFYFPFFIKFNDSQKWIIQSSTSYPRERMNGYQWNSLHLKNIDENIRKALVIYPDTMKQNEIHQCIRYNKDIQENNIESAIDGVISFADLYILLEQKAFENLETGALKDKQGKAFEKWLVDILSHPANREIWNGKRSEDLGFNYPYFEKILTCFGISKGEKIYYIHATDNIPNLPPAPGKKKGGRPKTDVLVEIQKSIYEPKQKFTISSKRSSKEWVSIHQYSADTYINVLGIQEEELIEALFALQSAGAPTQINEKYQEILIRELPKYHVPLAKWAYSGIGGEGDPEIHWARYFTVYKNETKELEVYNLDEYIEKILKDVEGQFGSPFNFTYTGERGTNIQLRGKLL